MKKIENTALQMIAEASRCPDYGPDMVKSLMKKLDMNEKGFALLMNVAPSTVRLWTSGAAQPCGTAKRLIRLSVEDNKKRGCSVENQKLVLNDFLSDKPDFVVYDTYIDNGATGTNFHRPGFQQMLSDIEAGHINCVIVKDLSRLGRNSIDTGYYIEQYFHAHNVRFIAVTDQFDTADSGNLHGGIMLPLKNMINEAYALDIGRKIKAQARQAMKDGDYIGARAPYGYRKDPDNCHKLLIDENTAPVVKQIFEWAHEHVSLNRIVRNLNEMGIPAPSHYKKATGEITSPGLIGSGKWQTRTVMKILESEVYTGDLVQGKTKIVDHQQVKAGEDNLIIA